MNELCEECSDFGIVQDILFGPTESSGDYLVSHDGGETWCKATWRDRFWFWAMWIKGIIKTALGVSE